LIPTIIEPGAYAVLAKTADGWPYAVPLDGEDGHSATFNNDGTTERVRLLNGGPSELDRTAGIGVTADFEGASNSLDPAQLDVIGNDDPDNWCPAVTPLTTSAAGPEFGTPGEDNDPC